jgi:uncharacterized membrane protein YgcG
VLLVVFVQDRKLRLEVGYGLEAVLPDADASQIIRAAIAPRFREQRYAAGLEAAVLAVYERIKPGSTPPGAFDRSASRRRSGGFNPFLLFFLVLVIFTVGGLAWEASHQKGYTAGRRGWRSSGGGMVRRRLGRRRLLGRWRIRRRWRRRVLGRRRQLGRRRRERKLVMAKASGVDAALPQRVRFRRGHPRDRGRRGAHVRRDPRAPGAPRAAAALGGARARHPDAGAPSLQAPRDAQTVERHAC